jgi:hypothetical protein
MLPLWEEIQHVWKDQFISAPYGNPSGGRYEEVDRDDAPYEEDNVDSGRTFHTAFAEGPRDHFIALQRSQAIRRQVLAAWQKRR